MSYLAMVHNNQKTKMGRKTTVRIFQATNMRNLTQENIGMAKKGKPLEKNKVSSYSCTKQRHKDELRLNKNR